MMRCAIYGRVSTAEQSAEMQLQELRDYCKRRGWEIANEFVDTGVSGSKESRPALNRLLADAKRRKFQIVLVYRYDRFARSLRQLVNALGEFDALGIHFVSLHEGVEAPTPAKRAAHIKLVGLIHPRAQTAVVPLCSHAEKPIPVSA